MNDTAITTTTTKKTGNLRGQKYKKYPSGVHALESSNIFVWPKIKWILRVAQAETGTSQCSVFRRTGWCGWSFEWKMDFVQKKRTTWVREHSTVCDETDSWTGLPSFHIYPSCILYGTSCIQCICSYIYTNIHIYLKHTSTCINIDVHFFFFFKKPVCNAKCFLFSWLSQQRFWFVLCGKNFSFYLFIYFLIYLFIYLFLFTQNIQIKVTTCMPECR